APHDGVGRPLARRLVGKQRRVDAAEDDPRAARADLTADVIPAERVAGMDPDADDITRLDRVEIDRFQGFVRDLRIAPAAAGRGRQDVQPAWRNDGDAERLRARIDQMDAWHRAPCQSTDWARQVTTMLALDHGEMEAAPDTLTSWRFGEGSAG